VEEAPKKHAEPELVDAEIEEPRPRTRVAQELTREPPRALAQAPTTGVAVYAAAAGLVSVVPIPFVDGILTGVARGSAVRRIAGRRGVRLTREARKTLASISITRPTGTGAARLLRMALSRALSPIRIASRVEDATATVLSAILLDHYLATSSRRVGSPLDDREARRVRDAMESAFSASGLESLRTLPLGALDVFLGAGRAAFAIDSEDRGPVERFVDTLLDGAADAPSEWSERLRVLFDEALVREERG
jgi:hypothetical protein